MRAPHAPPPAGAADPNLASLFQTVAARARAAAVFGDIRIHSARLVCTALNSAEPAEYRLESDGRRLWVSLVTADRWLSQSIEADLVHTGDNLAELIEEELADQGHTGGPLPFEHFRSEDLLFTFRSPVPFDLPRAGTPEAADTGARCLLAYEACFRQLGDMDARDDDDSTRKP